MPTITNNKPEDNKPSQDQEAVMFQAEIARTGTYRGYHGDPESSFSISRDDLISMVKNFQDKTLSNDLPVYVGHGVPDNFPGTEPPAVGWIRSLSVQENPRQPVIGKTWSLLAQVEMTGQSYQQYIESKSFQFTSIEAILGAGIIHPVQGDNTGALLTGLALTNQPFIRGMKEITSSLSVVNPQKVFYCSFTNKGLTDNNGIKKNKVEMETNYMTNLAVVATSEETETPKMMETSPSGVSLAVTGKKTKEKDMVPEGDQEEATSTTEEETPSAVELITVEEETETPGVISSEEEEQMEPASDKVVEGEEEEIVVEVAPPESEDNKEDTTDEETSIMDEKTKELVGLVQELLAKLMPKGETDTSQEDSSPPTLDSLDKAIEAARKALEGPTNQMSALLSRAERAEALVESGKTLSATAMVDLAVRRNLLPATDTDKYLKMFKEEPVKFSETFAGLFDSNKADSAKTVNAPPDYEKNLLGKLSLSNANLKARIEQGGKNQSSSLGEIKLTQVTTPSVRDNLTSGGNKVAGPRSNQTWEEKYLSRIKK